MGEDRESEKGVCQVKFFNSAHKNKLLWLAPVTALIVAGLFLSIFVIGYHEPINPSCMAWAASVGTGGNIVRLSGDLTASEEMKLFAQHLYMENDQEPHRFWVKFLSQLSLLDRIQPTTAIASANVPNPSLKTMPYIVVAQYQLDAKTVSNPTSAEITEETTVVEDISSSTRQVLINDCVKQDRLVVSLRRKTGFSLTLQIIVLLIFFLMLFTPFIPGLIELHKPKDDQPLHVDLEYAKNPRYFGNSFRNIMIKVLNPDGENSNGPMINVLLSKDETVETSNDKKIESKEVVPHILYVDGELTVDFQATLEKEAYVLGNATFQNGCTIRALACDSDIILGAASRVVRWIDAEGNILVESDCDLGVSASCDEILTLSAGVKFKRLFGKPIQTYSNKNGNGSQVIYTSPEKISQKTENFKSIGDVLHYANGNLILKSGRELEKDLVVHGNLHAHEGVVFRGSVKVHGKVLLEKNVTVAGNLISEKAMRLEENCRVFGNVFCQSSLYISQGCQIGQFGKIKSIVSKRKLILAEDVIIYGFALTDGEGKVL